MSDENTQPTGARLSDTQLVEMGQQMITLFKWKDSADSAIKDLSSEVGKLSGAHEKSVALVEHSFRHLDEKFETFIQQDTNSTSQIMAEIRTLNEGQAAMRQSLMRVDAVEKAQDQQSTEIVDMRKQNREKFSKLSTTVVEERHRRELEHQAAMQEIKHAREMNEQSKTLILSTFESTKTDMKEALATHESANHTEFDSLTKRFDKVDQSIEDFKKIKYTIIGVGVLLGALVAAFTVITFIRTGSVNGQAPPTQTAIHTKTP